jgi:hypothetical protein
MDDAKPVNAQNSEAARKRVKEIMEGAPKPDGMINQVWQVLTPEQKTAVETRWQALKREHAAERDQRMAEEVVARKKGEAASAPEGARKKHRPIRGKQPDAPAPDANSNEAGNS